MTTEEFVERITGLRNSADTIATEIKNCFSDYIAERSPFAASRENPVLCDLTYSYRFKMNEFIEQGTVSGQVWVVGWETAEVYGQKHMGSVVPVMYRNTNGKMGEAAHFRLGTDFDSISIVPVNKEEDEDDGQCRLIGGVDSSTCLGSEVILSSPNILEKIKNKFQ